MTKGLIHWFGTHCKIRYVIQPTTLNVLGGACKRISLPSDIRHERIRCVIISRYHAIKIVIYLVNGVAAWLSRYNVGF